MENTFSVHHFGISSNIAKKFGKENEDKSPYFKLPKNPILGYQSVTITYSLVVGPSGRSIVLKVINFMKRSIISPVKLDDLPH